MRRTVNVAAFCELTPSAACAPRSGGIAVKKKDRYFALHELISSFLDSDLTAA